MRYFIDDLCLRLPLFAPLRGFIGETAAMILFAFCERADIVILLEDGEIQDVLSQSLPLPRTL